MQGKVNPLIAVAAGVVIVALAIFFYVRSRPPVAAGVSPVSSSAYSHPGPGNHP